jgi:urease accessory protein
VNAKESLIRARRVIPAASDELSCASDVVELTYDERHRRRIRMTSVEGRAFLLDLPKAVALSEGDHLLLDDGSTVGVRAIPERVIDIRAESARRLTTIAWHLGNRHWPTQVLDDGLRIRFDPVLIDMVKGLGGIVSIQDAPFQPEGGAYSHGH